MVGRKVSSLTMVSMESDGGAVIGLEVDQFGLSHKFLLQMSDLYTISKNLKTFSIWFFKSVLVKNSILFKWKVVSLNHLTIKT